MAGVLTDDATPTAPVMTGSSLPGPPLPPPAAPPQPPAKDDGAAGSGDGAASGDATASRGSRVLAAVGNAAGAVKNKVVGGVQQVPQVVQDIKDGSKPAVEPNQHGYAQEEDGTDMDTTFEVLVAAKEEEGGKGTREVNPKDIVVVTAKVELKISKPGADGKHHETWEEIMNTKKKYKVGEDGNVQIDAYERPVKEMVTVTKKKPKLGKDGKPEFDAHGQPVLTDEDVEEWAEKDLSEDMTFKYQVGVKSLIPGWDRGTLGMKLGETRLLHVPPCDGYGSAGFPEWGVPPGAHLCITLECLDIQKPPSRRS